MNSEKSNRKNRLIRITCISILTVVILIIIVVLIAWIWAKPVSPDSFYTAPEKLPLDHGVLLRQEPFVGNIPANVHAWKILYTTTKNDGSQGVASGVVVIPNTLPDGPRPVVAYAHGTIGVVPGCAPSIVEEEYPNGSARALLNTALSNGWIFVGTDYIGLGTSESHPFLIGEGEGYSVLDSVRAVRQMKELKLDDKTIIWGHSQGGHAALWSGILAKKYTPELSILGIAALSPASDLPNLLQRVADKPVGRLFSSFIARAYSSIYPDVHFNEIVNPNTQLLTTDIASRCLSGKKTLFSVVEASLLQGSIFSANPTTGAFGERLKQNVPHEVIPFPLMIGQGKADDLVDLATQNNYVKSRCDAGQSVEYRRYEGKGHLDILAEDSQLIPDITSWTMSRFEHKSQLATCATIDK